MFLETLYKISRQTGRLFWYWRSGNMINYDFYLFCFQFTIKILLALFNLARSRCLFYWFTFVLLSIRDLKISIQKEKMSFFSSWLLVIITRRNWKKLKKAILENNINVQNQPLVGFYKKTVLKYFAQLADTVDARKTVR